MELRLIDDWQHIWIGGSGPSPIEISFAASARCDKDDQFILEATPASVKPFHG